MFLISKLNFEYFPLYFVVEIHKIKKVPSTFLNHSEHRILLKPKSTHTEKTTKKINIVLLKNEFKWIVCEYGLD